MLYVYIPSFPLPFSISILSGTLLHKHIFSYNGQKAGCKPRQPYRPLLFAKHSCSHTYTYPVDPCSLICMNMYVMFHLEIFNTEI